MNRKIEDTKTVTIPHDMLERVKAEFLNDDYIREPAYTVYRIDKYAYRYYLKVDGDNHMTGAGTTSILGSEMPTSRFLSEWQMDMTAKNGANYVKWFLNQSACYGTFLHVVYGELLRGLEFKFDIDSLNTKMDLFCIQNDYDFTELMKWYKQEKRKLRKDILSFVQWTKDYKIIPLAIEYPFVCENEIGNYAGTIDLVAKATFKDVEKIIMVDFKSGKNFYESHEIQLKAYSEAWNKEFPELQIEEFYNFAPKDFRMKSGKEVVPTYNFKNQTKSEYAKRWPIYLQLFYMTESHKHLARKIDFANDTISLNSEIAFIEYDPVDAIVSEGAF